MSKPKPKVVSTEPIETFGYEGPKMKTQYDYDCWAFANRRTGGQHIRVFQRIADTVAPGWFEWHAWTLKIIDSLCRYRWSAVLGCSNSSKTRNIAGFSVIWWLTDPFESSVIFCSTTMKSLRKRGWAEVVDLYEKIKEGHMINSQTLWQASKGDDKHAIFGKAVAEGDTNKVAADIQGIHTKRQMIVIDEAEAVPAAIWKAAANLYSYPADSGGEFKFCPIANPRSRLSQFGRFIEPDTGWDTVGVDTDDWMSKPQLDGKRASVIRLDFLKSPNLTEGKTVSKHIPTKARVMARMAALKAAGAENSADHFAYDRGFPTPDGLLPTVFTESLLEMHKAYDKHEFTGRGNWLIIGAFDPAGLGGDRPTLRFGAMGEIADHKMGIEWMPPITLSIDSTRAVPSKYQLVEQLKKHCAMVSFRGQLHECLPENLGIDVTGDSGVYEIAKQEWNKGALVNIIPVMFSGSPSDEPCSFEDTRPCSEVYLNKRVEMYFTTRNAVISGQIKGIDKDTASELCSIEELTLKTDGSIRPRKSLMNKREYKKKFQKSPDDADSGIILTEVARIKGFKITAVGGSAFGSVSFDKQVQESLEVYEDITYSPVEIYATTTY